MASRWRGGEGGSEGLGVESEKVVRERSVESLHHWTHTHTHTYTYTHTHTQTRADTFEIDTSFNTHFKSGTGVNTNTKTTTTTTITTTTSKVKTSASTHLTLEAALLAFQVRNACLPMLPFLLCRQRQCIAQ